VSVNTQALDLAVRAFQRDNPERGYCTCFGCVATINANYNAIMTGPDWPPVARERSEHLSPLAPVAADPGGTIPNIEDAPSGLAVGAFRPSGMRPRLVEPPIRDEKTKTQERSG
jgi:hypothetical protein